MSETMPFRLVVCPTCYGLAAIPKNHHGFYCFTCDNLNNIDNCFKLGLRENKETGEWTWEGVKDE